MVRRPVIALVLTLTLLTAGFVTDLHAATINAATCSAADVSRAINRASAGDTVQIPAGTCVWTTKLSSTVPANISIIGAGSLATVGGGDATVIVDNQTSTADFLWSISTNARGTFRLAGITFQGGTGVVKENAILFILGSSQQIRIDHSHFNCTSGCNNSKWIRFTGTMAGVVDRNRLDGSNQGNYIFFEGEDEGDAAWAQVTGYGGAGMIYVEDNLVVSHSRFHGGATDCNNGGKFVIRYNDIRQSPVGQTHPTGGQGRGRGCRHHELYRNVQTAAAWYTPGGGMEPFNTFSYMTSGTLLLWGNSLGAGLFKNLLTLNNCRKNTDCNYPPFAAPPLGWGFCGSQHAGSTSPWDGNTSPGTGYPCLDNPGRGRGDLLSGDFPRVVNTRTRTAAWPNQALEPIYEWLNAGSFQGGWGPTGDVNNNAAGRINQNQDYFLETATFNGTSGVGVGLLSARPQTCTPGVGFFATDQGGDWSTEDAAVHASHGSNHALGADGALYTCTARDTWTLLYVPYSYPHPLVRRLRS
jgi:hypothetical protein